MRVRLLGIAAVALSLSCASAQQRDPSGLRDGDIIFHTSRSSQSEALRRAMDSPYTHMGVIFIEQGRPFVYEAVGPVKSTPFDEWVRRGVDGSYVVKRLVDVDRILTGEAVQRLPDAGERHRGRPYDLYFEWSDERIYCSELVWKMFNEAVGLSIGELQQFGDFDLSDPLVKDKLRERFGDSVPTDETVISPASMFSSGSLTTVHER
jgi:hypothetical protein